MAITPYFLTSSGDVAINNLPPTTATQAGGAGASGGVAKKSGNLWMQTPAGGTAPGLTAADIVVATALIPAGAFDIANRNVTITANGNFAGNTNAKTIKIVVAPTTANIGAAVVGGITIASIGAVTTSGSAWALGADIIKTGVNGSNTQTAIHMQALCGATVQPLTPCQSLTLTENATILVAITINCATTATDCSLWNFQGQWFN